jgi:hypothetical protein
MESRKKASAGLADHTHIRRGPRASTAVWMLIIGFLALAGLSWLIVRTVNLADAADQVSVRGLRLAAGVAESLGVADGWKTAIAHTASDLGLWVARQVQSVDALGRGLARVPSTLANASAHARLPLLLAAGSWLVILAASAGITLARSARGMSRMRRPTRACDVTGRRAGALDSTPSSAA